MQELQAAHGRGRLEAELESMSGDVLRQVNKAANLPVRTHEGRIPVAELRSALLAHLLSASDDQEQARHVGIGVCSDRILLEYLLDIYHGLLLLCHDQDSRPYVVFVGTSRA